MERGSSVTLYLSDHTYTNLMIRLKALLRIIRMDQQSDVPSAVTKMILLKGL